MTHRKTNSASPQQVERNPSPTTVTAAFLPSAFLFLLDGQTFSSRTGRTSGLPLCSYDRYGNMTCSQNSNTNGQRGSGEWLVVSG